VLVAAFIVLYMSLPAVWLLLLLRQRHLLNGPHARSGNSDDAAPSLRPLRFLFSVYAPSYFFWEVLEMYRRVLLVGALPLLSARSSRRAALGVVFALLSAVAYREMQPFAVGHNNQLAHVAQLSILLTFGAALALDTDIGNNVDNTFLFGLLLVVGNGVVLALALAMGAKRHYLDERRQWTWRRLLTTQEVRVIEEVMKGKEGGAGGFGGGGDVELSTSTSPAAASGEILARHKAANRILRQHLLRPVDVKLAARVGAGAFGEVFKGTCLGEPCAVKTMLNVTEDNVKAFRAEILLTATLRHPNIVHFVGACWGKELTCLVLEWVPSGSIGSLLEDDPGGGALRWDEPLLRLACDVARGMAYLHGREFIDDFDGRRKRGVLHRDLKPDNVLVTAHLRAKIADFGGSRALDASALAATTVGTPLFCAPEIMRGEAYDEKVDVYSFGVMLVDMASANGLLRFVVRRFCCDDGMLQPRGPPTEEETRIATKALQGVWAGVWRPIDESADLFSSTDSGSDGDGPPTFSITTPGLSDSMDGAAMRAASALPDAPPSVVLLAARCMCHDAAARPSFAAALDVLAGAAAREAEAARFGRGGRQNAAGVLSSAQPESGPFNLIRATSKTGMEGRMSNMGRTASIEVPSEGVAAHVGLSSGSALGSTTGSSTSLSSEAREGREGLPPGWEAILDPSTGRHYFGNASTGETTWERPKSLLGQAAADTARTDGQRDSMVEKMEVHEF